MPRLSDIKKQLSNISENNSVLDILVEFERTLDNSNLYSYKNWLCGELVQGPDIERYWVTCKFMYPYKMMPDPMGGMRLVKAGCEVSYDKDTFLVPVVTAKDGVSQQYARQRKIKKHPVWIVTIKMPKRFIDERMADEIEYKYSINVDTADISQAYDSDVGEADMGNM